MEREVTLGRAELSLLRADDVSPGLEKPAPSFSTSGLPNNPPFMLPQSCRSSAARQPAPWQAAGWRRC